jgi:hypothetical protein
LPACVRAAPLRTTPPHFLLSPRNSEVRTRGWLYGRQRRVVILYRRFGTAYRSHRSDRFFFRNVSTELPRYITQRRVVIDVSGQPIGPTGPIGCPETSVKDYHSTLRNIAEERRSHAPVNSLCTSLQKNCCAPDSIRRPQQTAGRPEAHTAALTFTTVRSVFDSTERSCDVIHTIGKSGERRDRQRHRTVLLLQFTMSKCRDRT